MYECVDPIPPIISSRSYGSVINFFISMSLLAFLNAAGMGS